MEQIILLSNLCPRGGTSNYASIGCRISRRLFQVACLGNYLGNKHNDVMQKFEVEFWKATMISLCMILQSTTMLYRVLSYMCMEYLWFKQY